MIWKFNSKVPIAHVASMARSGETLLLRCLSQHSRLRVVHNLSKVDQAYELALFEFLQSYQPNSISKTHALVKPYQLRRGQQLVLKQGVWRHPHPFDGIVLARNPIAIFASLRQYDVQATGKPWQAVWHLNEARMTRWLGDIAPDALDGFESLGPVDQFARFYNVRMTQLLETKKQMIRYEDLVFNPQQNLEKIATELDVDFEPATLHSHQGYQADAEGHGQNNLGQPISTKSVFKYLDVLSEAEFDQLATKVDSVARMAGYQLHWGSSGLLSIDNYRKAMAG